MHLESLDPAALVAANYAAHPARPRKSGKSGKSGKSKSTWDYRQFIAWDGEGHNLPAHNEHGDANHIYTYLANSDGEETYNAIGISSKEALELLLDSADENPHAINVVYGGSYDMNMILRDLDKETMEAINATDGRDFINFEIDGTAYGVRFIQRKYLAVGRYAAPDHLFLEYKPGKWRRNFNANVVLWDVIGFFQSSFITAVENWLGKDYPDLKLIREGKAKRGDFEHETIEYIRRYNAAELRALVALMGALWDALNDMGLKLSRWDGAGAVAAAMNSKHEVKHWLGEEVSPEVQVALQHAYFGGRIEMGKYGYHKKTVYHYDINSAYPAAMYQLPQMALGVWLQALDEEAAQSPADAPTVSCFLVEWDLTKHELLFGPFPYRSGAQRKVLFPSRGVNWIWKPELVAALELLGPEGITIHARWSWNPINDHRPYDWIEDYYNQRKEMVAATKRDGKLRGAEKVIKLGLNSLYGKTAQRAGYDPSTGRIPPFHNLAYAGIITSQTRAALWRGAMQKPDSVIALATDGIFTTEKLDLDCPKEKELGKWEAAEHQAMILVQSGFYWIKDKNEWRGWSRGFDKVQTGPDYAQQMQAQIDTVLAGWKKNIDMVLFACTRFITIKTALSGANWWPRWCSWYSMRNEFGMKGRQLKLHPAGTKRIPGKGKPASSMVDTYPEINYTPHELSEIYTIPWIDTGEDDEYLIDAECELLNE